MININCPHRDSVDDIKNIISEKYTGDVKTILNRLKTKIENRYLDYSKVEFNQRLTAGTYSLEEKKALKHLYSSKTQTAKKVIEEVLNTKELIKEDCCVCCGIGEADEIDHFLPQEHFPEYSILHKNLVPICGTCNEIKGDNIPGVAKNYFHPMFDKLPDEQFISCQITYNQNIPTSDFTIPSKFQSTIIDQHFNDLKLKVRLEKSATQYFLQVTAFKTQYGDAYALELIKMDLSKLGLFFGTNYWKYILCTEMIKTNFITNI